LEKNIAFWETTWKIVCLKLPQSGSNQVHLEEHYAWENTYKVKNILPREAMEQIIPLLLVYIFIAIIELHLIRYI
jgi:hypothetical protein